MQSEPALAEYFTKLHPGQVVEVYVSRDTTKLEKLSAKRFELAKQLIAAEAESAKTGTPATRTLKTYGLLPHKKVDAVTSFTDEIAVISAQMKQLADTVQALLLRTTFVLLVLNTHY